jgi:hypothetical protein
MESKDKDTDVDIDQMMDKVYACVDKIDAHLTDQGIFAKEKFVTIAHLSNYLNYLLLLQFRKTENNSRKKFVEEQIEALKNIEKIFEYDHSKIIAKAEEENESVTSSN